MSAPKLSKQSENKVEIAESNYFWKPKANKLVGKVLISRIECDWKKLYYDLLENSDRGLLLAQAVTSQDLCLVQVLIELGVIPSAQTIITASSGSIDIMKTLLDNKKMSIPYKSLIAAINANNSAIVKLLLDDGRVDVVSSEEYGTDSIITAVTQGNPYIINLLLSDERVDPSVENNRAIYTAVQADNIQIVKMLLRDKRVNPSINITSSNALIAATEIGNLDIVRLLLEDPRTDISTIPAYILRKIENNRYDTKRGNIYIEISRLINMAVYSDTIRGMFLGYYSVVGTIDDVEIKNIFESKTGYSYFLRHVALEIPINDLSKNIYWLSSHLSRFTEIEKLQIHNAALDTLSNNVWQNDGGIYIIIRGFLELSTGITVGEILENLTRQGFHENDVTLTAMLIGAYLGYEKCVSKSFGGLRHAPHYLFEVADNYVKNGSLSKMLL